MSATVVPPVIPGPRQARVHVPETVDEVLRLRRDMPEASLVAGATWIMRAPVRGVPIPDDVILLSKVASLHDVSLADPLVLGSMTTLDRVARALSGMPDVAALVEASLHAATPALRRMITVGGSVGATDFSASDIVPALLSVDAQIIREEGVITQVHIPRSERISCHERLTWRSGGEYSVASVSLSVDPASGDVRVALGSIEAVPRRWSAVERELSAGVITPDNAARIAQRHVSELTPVTAPGIPGEYRVEVLPAVLARAVGRLL